MLPFWWKTIQKTMTIANMTTSAAMRFHSGTFSTAVFSGAGMMSSASSIGRASSTGFFRSPGPRYR